MWRQIRMPQWLHAVNWPVQFTWPHTCESWSIWLNMNVRYCCLMWEYCTVGRQKFDQMKHDSVSLFSHITNTRNMYLSQLRMWSVVAKQFWLEYPIHCSISMYPFDSEWDYSPTPLQLVALGVARNAEIRIHRPHLCPLLHQIQCCYINAIWVQSVHLTASDTNL